MGTTKRTKADDNSLELRVDSIHEHPEWHSQFVNDIALLKLNESVQYNDFIQAACLPSQDGERQDKDFSSCYALGWGSTSKNALDFNVDVKQCSLD